MPIRGVSVTPIMPPEKKACVAVVDDDENTRLFFKDVLEESESFCCVRCFSNAAQVLADEGVSSFDFVLMDINLPGLSGIECAKRLKALNPRIKIVMITASPDQSLVDRSLQAGADAFLMKPIAPEQCVATLKFAMSERPEKQAQEFHSVSCLTLTPRERQVMESLSEGLLYKEIADKIGISFSAVHKHQHKIFKKLGVANRTEAIRKWFGSKGSQYALRQG